jgi:hypothetical protein
MNPLGSLDTRIAASLPEVESFARPLEPLLRSNLDHRRASGPQARSLVCMSSTSIRLWELAEPVTYRCTNAGCPMAAVDLPAAA